MSPIESRGPMPPDVKARWERSLAGVDPQAITTQFEQSEAAASEDTFSGFLRRSIHQSGQTVTTLVAAARLDRERLALFLHGEGLLDSAEIDRLLIALGIHVASSAAQNP